MLYEVHRYDTNLCYFNKLVFTVLSCSYRLYTRYSVFFIANINLPTILYNAITMTLS